MFMNDHVVSQHLMTFNFFKYYWCLHITVSLTTAWCNWMEHNDVVFKSKVANSLEVVNLISIVILVHMWGGA